MDGKFCPPNLISQETDGRNKIFNLSQGSALKKKKKKFKSLLVVQIKTKFYLLIQKIYWFV